MITQDQVKAALEETDRNYVSSKDLSRNHAGTNREWGKALRKAEDNGLVEQWSQTTPITWRIL